MSALHEQLSRKLRELGVEERAWPGRDDGVLASVLFRGKELAHFHAVTNWTSGSARDVIKRERLVHPPDSPCTRIAR